MQEPREIEAIRAAALRKLGRNVINFAKIEGVLKALLESQFEGTLDATLPQQYENHQNRLQKRTLGQLASDFKPQWVSDFEHSDELVPNETVESSKATFSTSFQMAYADPERLAAKKRELANIVQERNQLIHQHLAPLDTRSVDDYLDLITLLDEQNPRLLAKLEELGSLLKDVLEYRKVLADFLRHPNLRNSSSLRSLPLRLSEWQIESHQAQVEHTRSPLPNLRCSLPTDSFPH